MPESDEVRGCAFEFRVADNNEQAPQFHCGGASVSTGCAKALAAKLYVLGSYRYFGGASVLEFPIRGTNGPHLHFPPA